MTPTAIAPAPNVGRANDRHVPLQQVEDALARMQFGTIQLTVHNGKLVQLDVTERHRFTG